MGIHHLRLNNMGNINIFLPTLQQHGNFVHTLRKFRCLVPVPAGNFDL